MAFVSPLLVQTASHHLKRSFKSRNGRSSTRGVVRSRSWLFRGRGPHEVTFRGARMGIRAVESYDTDFSLPPEVDQALRGYLNQPSFGAEVAGKAACKSAEFADILFQPVPFSKNTPRGMPSDLEWYLDNPRYVVINVPPLFMFKAKCFKPSRLCAIFRRVGVPAKELQFGNLERAEKEREGAQRRKAEESAMDNASEDPWKGMGKTISEMFSGDEEDDDLDHMVV